MVKKVQGVDGDIVECGDTRWPGATKTIDEFFSNKPESVQPHPKYIWKYHAIKQ